jgi:very-short-patch-repair endonuclease
LGVFPEPELPSEVGETNIPHTDNPTTSAPAIIEPATNPTHLQTLYNEADLHKRLLNSFYTARTYIEEQGVNVLYIALGALRWYEADASEQPRLAPLLLVPVELSRPSVQASFRLRYNEDEIGENLSLRAKLKSEFGFELPPLPDSEELDLTVYLDAVETAVSPKPRWSVDRTAVNLGFFSFGAFLMFNDLAPDAWPPEKPLVSHPLLQSLLQHGFREPPPAVSEEAHLDAVVSPQDSYQVVDADSSQTRVILDMKQGRNMVVQGPPGTGKSQTITNLIAEALSQDKTVLFVAEKMAALEVVKRRLDEVGLGDACLELHSHKTNKRAFLQELRRTIELGPPASRDYAADIQALIENRQKLNEYSEVVNTPIGQSGVAPHHAFGVLLRLNNRLSQVKCPDLDGRPLSRWSAAQARSWLERLEELESHLQRMGVPSEHPFWGSGCMSYQPAVGRQIAAAGDMAQASVAELKQAATRLAEAFGLPAPTNRREAIQVGQMAELALTTPSLQQIDLTDPAWLERAADIQAALQAAARSAELRQQYDDWLLPEAWSQNVLPIRQAYMTHGRKWYRFLIPEFRRARNELTGLSQQGLPPSVQEQQALAEAILDYQRQQPILAQHDGLLRQLFASRWQGLSSDVQTLQATGDWIIRLRQQTAEAIFPKELIAHLIAQPDFERLRRLNDELSQALDRSAETAANLAQQLQLNQNQRFGRANGLLSIPFAAQSELAQQWRQEIERLPEMAVFNNYVAQATQAGLRQIVEIAAVWPEAARHLRDLVERAWHETLIDQAMRKQPILSAFSGDQHDHRIQRFRSADRLSFEINRIELAERHWRRLPQHNNNAQSGQLGILRREFEKKRRHLPIRQLMIQAGHAVQTIKPVFMMSPFSAAMFLPPGSIHFDLVVFDEASQVRPADALGAIARGKQVIVVGDSRQLPPTNFFNQIVETDEESESATADMESVLGLFLAQGAPERMLRWHYRSRHESLIAVSNHEFYDNKLVIFPSPDAAKADSGVILRHLPDTVYDRGRSRANLQEARYVAEAVMEHARRRSELTLGVAAFSISQMQAIQDQLERLRRQDLSCESFFTSHPYEPFFVKNLENVQGDERDVIFISVGYGRTAQGQVAMNFGPLNQNGGERRLNVLITRARWRCEIFTNLTADDIDLSRTQARGVAAFKQYLQYAATGRLEIAVPTGGAAESPFEAEVADALRRAGYDLDIQVGSGGYRLDLAVKDQTRPGRYLLGIECDGAAYHSARSARDRDRLRQLVLENMGWKIHRIWSTDWFRAPGREFERVVQAIEAAQSQATAPPAKTSGAPAPPAAPIPRSDPPPLPPTPTEPYTLFVGVFAYYRVVITDYFHRLG